MKRFTVDSSAIQSMGYGADKQILELEYRNGGVYRYFRVPSEIYKELLDADSIGAFVNQRIKPLFECQEIRRRSA